MADDTIRPPDMVGAGAYSQPQNPSTLIDLLRSQGSMPTEALAMLGGPPASPGQAYASALAGGVSQMRGQPNPVQQQMAQQQQQQMQQMVLMQRVQEHRQKMAMQQEQRYLDMADTFLKSDDERTRTYGAKMRVSAAKRMGVNVPESLAEGLATRRLTDKASSDILVRMGMGYDDTMLSRIYPDLKAEDLAAYRGLAQDPKALRAAGFDPDQVRKGQLDMRIKAGQAAEAGHPELRGDARRVQAAIIAHQKTTGKSYLEGDAGSQTKALEAANQQVQDEDERRAKLQNQLTFDRALLLAQIRADMAAKKPLTPIQKQKLLEPVLKSRDVLRSLDTLDEQIDSMDKLGALPTGEDWFSQQKSRIYRETVLRGNQAVFNFKQLWGPISIGQIDRGMFDEKGIRAIQAFSKQLDAVDNIVPAKAMKDYTRTVREQINRKVRDSVADWEDLGYPEDVIGVAKRVLPGAPQTLPKSPLTPPADLVWDSKKGWVTPNAPR